MLGIVFERWGGGTHPKNLDTKKEWGGGQLHDNSIFFNLRKIFASKKVEEGGGVGRSRMHWC